jgi:hypothetical protein
VANFVRKLADQIEPVRILNSSPSEKELPMTTFKMRVLAILSLIAIFVPFTALAQESTDFAIPFDFSVGPKSFRAGVYNVRETTPDTLQIRSKDSRTGILTVANTAGRSRYEGLSVMSFERYGDRYFLSNVSNPDRGWALRESGDEKAPGGQEGTTGQTARRCRIFATLIGRVPGL